MNENCLFIKIIFSYPFLPDFFNDEYAEGSVKQQINRVWPKGKIVW